MARRLIRGGEAPIVRASRFVAELRAEEMLAEARAKASAIVEAAERRAEALIDEARESCARAEARAREEREARRRALLEESTEDLLRLGLELARRITRATLRDDDAAFARMAEALIDEASLEGPGWLRVPEGAHAAIEGFESVVDPSLAPGDAIVESEGARLDARLDERLAQLGHALRAPKTS